MSDDFEDYEAPDISGTLIRSFFAVTTGIVIATFGYFTLIAIVMLVFFPSVRENLGAAGTEAAQQNAAVNAEDEASVSNKKDQPEEKQSTIKIPPQVFVLCPFAQALMAFAGGYVAARLSPSSPLGHGALVAGFVLLTAMQLLLSNETLMPTWVSAINAIAGPAFVMWGASIFDRSLPASEGESIQEDELPDDIEAV